MPITGFPKKSQGKKNPSWMSGKDICRAGLLSWHGINSFIRAIKGGSGAASSATSLPWGLGIPQLSPAPLPSLPARLGLPIVGTGCCPGLGGPLIQDRVSQVTGLPLELLKFLPPLRAPIPSVWESALPGAARLKIRFSPLLTQNVTKPGRKDGAGPGFGVLRAAIRELFGSSVEGATLIYLGCPEGWRMELCLCWGKMFSSADSLGSAVPRHTAQHILGVVRIFIQGFLTLSS